MRGVYSSLLFLIMILSSCSDKQDNVLIFREFNNQEWARFEYLEADFDVSKAPQKYDISMEIVVNDDYPNTYNLHQKECPLLFNLTISNPDGNGNRSRDYQFQLKDKDGNWKSDKQDGYYVFKLPIMSEMTFGEEGKYHFSIENKYPKDPLQGIKSLTIKCNKSK